MFKLNKSKLRLTFANLSQSFCIDTDRTGALTVFVYVFFFSAVVDQCVKLISLVCKESMVQNKEIHVIILW